MSYLELSELPGIGWNTAYPGRKVYMQKLGFPMTEQAPALILELSNRPTLVQSYTGIDEFRWKSYFCDWLTIGLLQSKIVVIFCLYMDVNPIFALGNLLKQVFHLF